MGLLITAYEVIGPHPDRCIKCNSFEFISDGRCRNCGYVHPNLIMLHGDYHFAESAAPWRLGQWLLANEIAEFRIGYIGWNHIRNALFQQVLGQNYSAEALVMHRDNAYPFKALLDFTDCDGVLGRDAVEQLRNDFREHEASVKKAFLPYQEERPQLFEKLEALFRSPITLVQFQ